MGCQRYAQKPASPCDDDRATELVFVHFSPRTFKSAQMLLIEKPQVTANRNCVPVHKIASVFIGHRQNFLKFSSPYPDFLPAFRAKLQCTSGRAIPARPQARELQPIE
jgi:hypothetical protein